MSSNRLAEAMTDLYNLFTAALLPTPAGEPGLTITNGPLPTAQADPQYIIVGHDGTLDASGALAVATQSGTFTTTFVVMGSPPQLQQETGQVHIVAVCQDGESANLPGQVSEAEELVAACADACAGQKVGDILFDTDTTGRLLTRQYAQGCAAIYAFSIGYTAPW